MRDKKIVRVAVTASRLLLGIIFLTAGLSKLIEGVPGIIGPVWLEERMAPHGLALFARYVAISEAVVGAMLLTRFATLAAIMLVPLLLSIFMVTVSLGWQGTPYVNAFLLVINAGLLIYDWPKLKFILTDRPEAVDKIPLERKAPRGDALWMLGMALFIGGMLLAGAGVIAPSLTFGGLLVMFAAVLAPVWRPRRAAA